MKTTDVRKANFCAEWHYLITGPVVLNRLDCTSNQMPELNLLSCSCWCDRMPGGHAPIPFLSTCEMTWRSCLLSITDTVSDSSRWSNVLQVNIILRRIVVSTRYWEVLSFLWEGESYARYAQLNTRGWVAWLHSSGEDMSLSVSWWTENENSWFYCIWSFLSNAVLCSWADVMRLCRLWFWMSD